MASPNIGGANIDFGLTDYTFGYVENLSKSRELEHEVDQMNGSGQVIGTHHVPTKIKCSGKYTVITTVSGADTFVGTGTAIDLSSNSDFSGDWYVTSSTTEYTRDGFRTVSFEATQYSHLVA